MIPGILDIKIDIFSLLMFIGVVQGYFLSFFFLKFGRRGVKYDFYLGLFLVVLSTLSIDVLLCYSNYMFKVIYLNDSTEFLNFLIGPLFYLYFREKYMKGINGRKIYHFMPSAIYFIYSLPNLLESNNYKYNNYISAYHPDLDYKAATNPALLDPLLFKQYVNELTLLSLLFYLIIISKQYYFQSGKQKENINIKREMSIDVTFFFLTVTLMLIIKIMFTNDFGDHFIVSLIVMNIFYFSYRVISDSRYFSRQIQKSSSLPEEIEKRIVRKLKIVMEEEKYYLNSSASLPDLAKNLDTSTNILSTVLNKTMNKTFYELLAEYRVKEAINLMNENGNNSTIEMLAFQVGYNSKSTFNKVFKQITGKTPSEYRKVQ